jgi:urease accessory protein
MDFACLVHGCHAPDFFMRHRPLFSLLFVLLLSLVATMTANAHHLPPGMEDVDEFADQASFFVGFNHPLTGFDHMAVALITGWLAAKLTGRVRAVLIPGSLLALLGGALLAPLGLRLPAAETVMMASVVLSVVVVSLRSTGWMQIGAGTLVCFQLWHGNGHALSAPLRSTGGMYVAGVATATALAMVLGWSLALLARRHLPGVWSGAQPA